MPELGLYAHEPIGRAESPLLVLGPALGAGSSMWSEVAEELASDFRTQTIEHFGFGDAPVMQEAFSIADLADGVASLIDAAGADKAYFAGDSISGAIGLELARRHPHRVIAIAAVCSVARRSGDASMAGLANGVRQEGTASRAADIADRWFAPGASKTRGDQIDELVATLAAADDETYARYIEALDAHDIGDHLAEISVPVLAVWSEYDMGDAEGKMRFMADGVQRGTLVGVEDAGHTPPIEQPEAVARALREFFHSVR
jgi:3-oxoadipate enol-lactonase